MSALGDKPSVWGWLVEDVEFSTGLNTKVHSLSEEEHGAGRDSSSSIVLGEGLCRALTEEISQDGEGNDPNQLSRLHFQVIKMFFGGLFAFYRTL